MLLEMISTGEEVLSGQIVDTNAAWFADSMMNLGIELQRRSTVGDRMDDLVAVFGERSRAADLILVNGGLGPTSDDLSAAAAARAAGVELVEHQGWRTHLDQWFRKRGRPMVASNLKQCLIPCGAVLIDNPSGSAPGFRLKLNRAWLFFTPGVPAEFKPMVNEQFVPFMQQEFRQDTATRLRKLLTFGHGESLLAERIDTVPVPAGITLGYRPSPPHVEIKVFARGETAIGTLDAYVASLQRLLGDAVVSTRFASLTEEVHHLLLGGKTTLALAESCSGGMLASQLVDFAGSSTYLQHSVVAYANEAKTALLGVPAATLQAHGAVSPETALAMARGARNRLDSDYALAITGIAGPDGGSDDKPVGTVAVALCDRLQSWVQVLQLSQRSRNLVRTMSCAVALDMLRRRLLGSEPVVTYSFLPARLSYREANG
ncbi:MAG TPA: CinA family nicotinamide mononucleotide deamidase-related protein [Candidatus Acidoferrum sp.]|nr:CinA family nicotinamide mononucleotide deamidase-related protein [Candidatus Acidoferrum sp.]